MTKLAQRERETMMVITEVDNVMKDLSPQKAWTETVLSNFKKYIIMIVISLFQ